MVNYYAIMITVINRIFNAGNLMQFVDSLLRKWIFYFMQRISNDCIIQSFKPLFVKTVLLFHEV